MYEKTTLPNGLRIVTETIPTSHSVAIAFVVGTGSRYEAAPEAGISHFVEHLLFKGTERRPTAKEVAETIEGVGGVLNAGTEKEITTFFAKVARQHRGLALDLLADMLRHSRFEPEEVEKERHVITEEIHMAEDVPQDLVNAQIDELIWPDHPLGREIAGTVQSVSALPRAALLDYVARHYVPNNVVLSVAGNVSHADVVGHAGRLFGDWQPHALASYEPAPPQFGSTRQHIRFKDTEQAHLCLSTGGLPRHHPDRRAQDIQNLILGGGMSSRLFLEIRERRAIAYDVAAYLDYLQDTGATVVYAGTDPEKVPACIEAVLDELRRLRDQPVTDDELGRAKEYFKGRMLLGLEDTYTVASWLASQELLMGRIVTVDDIIAQVDAVTADDVQRVSQTVFAPESFHLAVVGPVRESRAIKDLLAAG